MLIGKSASQGIAVGKALVLGQLELKIEEGSAHDIEHEIKRLHRSLGLSRDDITRLHATVLRNLGNDKAQIFEAHLMILDDPELVDSILGHITSEKSKATKAVRVVADQFISMFQAMDQEYLRERALDVKDVTDRILRNLLDIKSVDLATLDEDTILVAYDITPSQMATITKSVLGIVTEVGGKTSHTAIMARTLELPAVVGLKGACQQLKDGDTLIIDGDAGEVMANPNSDTLRIYKQKK